MCVQASKPIQAAQVEREEKELHTLEILLHLHEVGF